jgi:hypothetical protein
LAHNRFKRGLTDPKVVAQVTTPCDLGHQYRH